MNVVSANGPGSGILIGVDVRRDAYSNSATAPMPWGTPTGPVVSCTLRMSSDIGPIRRGAPPSRSPVIREANAHTKLARRISPSLMTSSPASSWSRIARSTASSNVSAMSTGPNRSASISSLAA
jgi:hypothetical protein